jgi:hypothetical protein
MIESALRRTIVANIGVFALLHPRHPGPGTLLARSSTIQLFEIE